MKMYNYKVIWFDDEFETLELIKENASINDIELIGFNNAKEGISELEKNIKNYDAAIIDGLFFIDNQQSGTPTSDRAFFDVAMALERLSPVKKLPWFILSGQISFTTEKNRYADGLKDNKVYDKLNNAHLESLWIDIKAEANNQFETQLKQKYCQILDVCDSKYIGDKQLDRLINIIKRIENNDVESGFEDMLTPIRKLLEALFIRLGELSIIPEKIIKNKGWLNGSSLFLSNRHSNFTFIKEIVHPFVAENIYRLLSIIQDGSHGEGELRLRVDQYFKTRNNDYLYRSVVFLLFDILIWLKEIIDQNPNAIENKKLWIEVINDLQYGIIEKDSNGNYHCNEVLFTYKHIKDNAYLLNDEVKLITVVENTNPKTMHLYSKCILVSEKVNKL